MVALGFLRQSQVLRLLAPVVEVAVKEQQKPPVRQPLVAVLVVLTLVVRLEPLTLVVAVVVLAHRALHALVVPVVPV
jgi:hypothetical protein